MADTTTADNKVKKKILVVEDELFIRELYVRILKNEGYEVYSAGDGEEAYNTILENKFDIILLDIMLPKMSGMDILQKLKNKEPTLRRKILMLTNLDQDVTVANCLSLGASGYLIKDQYPPENLVMEVRNALSPE
jgi:DNA-binding response OmpR family regulator